MKGEGEEEDRSQVERPRGGLARAERRLPRGEPGAVDCYL